MLYYGLVIKGTDKLLTVETQSNRDGDFCCDTQHILSTYEGDILWLVKERHHAERAAKQSFPWYNAGWETPSHGYGVQDKELEVVEVEINISVKINGQAAPIPKSLTIKESE